MKTEALAKVSQPFDVTNPHYVKWNETKKEHFPKFVELMQAIKKMKRCLEPHYETQIHRVVEIFDEIEAL